MYIRFISLAFILAAIMSTSVLADVLINEVELNPSGENESQWIELYNTGDTDVDISSWSVAPLSDQTKELFIDITSISSRGFYVILFDEEWMNPNEEKVILRDEAGKVIDRTPVLYDFYDSDCVWGRYPDGSNNWLFMISTQGQPSSGELCQDGESKNIGFDMNQRVYGSGYARVRNVIRSMDSEYLISMESGSGTYKSEKGIRYNAELEGVSYAMDLNKSNLSLRYSNTTFAISPNRSVSFDKKWSELSSAQGGQESPSLCEANTEITRLDSDVSIQYKNYELEAKMTSEFDGVSRIDSKLVDYEASEEYAGSFKILNNYYENISNEIKLSVAGEGFVSTEKRIGERVYSYEKGTGIYRSEEGIDASNVLLSKNISLRQKPVNHSYDRVAPLPLSIKWREGVRYCLENEAFTSSEFSDINELEAETVIASLEDVKTSANFDGRARFRAGFKDPMDSDLDFVSMDDEYAGDFSIYRSYKISPTSKAPHMSITSQGHIDPYECDTLKYVITVVNDGNRPLGPVFVRTSFPSGTSFLNASIKPFELTSRFANWSISSLGVGDSFNINLGLKITRRSENYVSSSRAITVYQVIRRGMSSDRKLSASNTSRLSADWNACDLRNLSATYSATINPRNNRIISYRLLVENLAKENMSANIIMMLPTGLAFINSTSKHEQISQDLFSWTIERLNAGRRRSISFMVEAKDDGYYVSNATVNVRSRDGRDIGSINVIAPVMVGKAVYEIMPTASQDWCPCDESLLGKLSWNETSTKSGKDLGCLC